MFEKFTEHSRKVFSHAREAAQELHQEFIGTEHILLGIFGVKTKAATVLKQCGLTRAAVSAEIVRRCPPPAGTATLGQLPFSPRAKRMIELAEQLANGKQITPEHFLLAVFEDRETLAFDVLSTFCVGEIVKQMLEKPAEDMTQKNADAEHYREGIRFWRLTILKGVKALLDSIPETECKTIGNMNPDDLHCFTCTFYDLKKRADRAVAFWLEDERWKRACS